MMKKLLIAITTLIGISLTIPAFASLKSLGKEVAWEAIQDSQRNLCFMVSFPVAVEGNFTRRDPAYVMISIRPSENVRNEVSYYAGYPYDTSRPVVFEIDGKSHNLYSQGEWAWAPDANVDTQILNAMIRGNELVVKGYSKRGTLTTDTYSLSGVTAAWNKAKSACGL